ncbi:hypothetical protein [Solirhodobacter olei]|uniref:hypothetical protein n=1 Tax=Solirhodobacter olei TaxID=2493082 RepID=UPI000FDBD214|nr:hypothetical protein [Solirhodobacter olei]
MKKIALAAAISLAASSAFAGNLKPPVMEKPVMVQTAKKTSSSSPIVVPLVLLAVVVAAVASKN